METHSHRYKKRKNEPASSDSDSSFSLDETEIDVVLNKKKCSSTIPKRKKGNNQSLNSKVKAVPIPNKKEKNEPSSSYSDSTSSSVGKNVVVKKQKCSSTISKETKVNDPSSKSKLETVSKKTKNNELLSPVYDLTLSSEESYVDLYKMKRPSAISKKKKGNDDSLESKLKSVSIEEKNINPVDHFSAKYLQLSDSDSSSSSDEGNVVLKKGICSSTIPKKRKVNDRSLKSKVENTVKKFKKMKPESPASDSDSSLSSDFDAKYTSTPSGSGLKRSASVPSRSRLRRTPIIPISSASGLKRAPASSSCVQKKRKIKVKKSKIRELYKKHQKSIWFSSRFTPGVDPDEAMRLFFLSTSPSIQFMYKDRQRHFKFTRDASPITRATELWESIKPPRGPNGKRKYHFFEKQGYRDNLSGTDSDHFSVDSDDSVVRDDYLTDTENSDDENKYYLADLLKYHMLPGYNYKY